MFGRLLALGALFCVLTLVWLSLYSIAIGRMRDAFSSSRVRRTLEGVTGTALVALGLRLAASDR